MAVPRFYFHLHDDMDVPDDLGAELPGLEAAIAHASEQMRRLAGQMLAETGRIVVDQYIDIEDERGTVLQRLSFRDAISVEVVLSQDLETDL